MQLDKKKDKTDKKEKVQIKQNPPYEVPKKTLSPNQQVQEDLKSGKLQVQKNNFMRHIWEKGRRGEFPAWKRGIGGLIDEYREFKTGKQEFLEKYEAYETVVAGATDTIDYYILLFFSCLIAVFGLLQNSPAVIIGAMIVAPLMGPIFGLSAGVLWGSPGVIWESFTTLIKGILLVLVLATGFAWFLPGTVLTQELISRGHPGLFDIFVAIACGFIGAFSYVNKRISSVVSGVAISVALLPPLCSAGIGLGLKEWELAKGAFLLFGVNLAGIILASSIVFYLVRLHPHTYEKGDRFKAAARAASQVVLSLILITLISIPLIYWTRQAAQMRNTKQTILDEVARTLPDSRVYSMDLRTGPTNQLELIILDQGRGGKVDSALLQSRLSTLVSNKLELKLYVLNSLK